MLYRNPMIFLIIFMIIHGGFLSWQMSLVFQSEQSSQEILFDLEELARLDGEFNQALLYKKNLKSIEDNLSSKLDIFITKLNEEKKLHHYIYKIKNYHEHKIKFMKEKQQLENIEMLLVNELHQHIYVLQKEKITFTLDQKDFYKELVFNLFQLLLTNQSEYFEKFTENKKILNQIYVYSNTPNPNIEKMKRLHERLYQNYEAQKEVQEKIPWIMKEDLYRDIKAFILDEKKNQEQRFLWIYVILFIVFVLTMTLYFKRYSKSYV